ncbi:MAG: hypothetical protein QOK40_1168 [Miltoncostaeaceae bacterium]|nr:hypothetical protein [Miltoncostaeaceae bacterium]
MRPVRRVGRVRLPHLRLPHPRLPHPYYAHRHVTRGALVVAALGAGLAAFLAVGSMQTAGSATAAKPSPTASPVAVAPSASAPPRAVPLPSLPPLPALVPATVLVTSKSRLPADTVRRLVALTGARASLRVAVGDVGLGKGRTRALAADPALIRVWTPRQTATVVGVWQRAAIGEAVVAHTVAKADAVSLGGTVRVQRGATALPLRVGALATTQLPGVGVVLDRSVGRQLGLVEGTGLLLSVPGRDPAIVAALGSHELGAAATVEAVLSASAPTGSWVPPVIGRISSGFGNRVHPFSHAVQFHDGIDIGAPLGAPVYAMTDGQVLYAGPAAGFGNEIVLSHAGGVTTVYGHVSQILVTSGRVRVGQVIALVGNEGESTGPHLHAEVHVQDVPVDPVRWLVDHGVDVQR